MTYKLKTVEHGRGPTLSSEREQRRKRRKGGGREEERNEEFNIKRS
jgi:hypothetical protein